MNVCAVLEPLPSPAAAQSFTSSNNPDSQMFTHLPSCVDHAFTRSAPLKPLPYPAVTATASVDSPISLQAERHSRMNTLPPATPLSFVCESMQSDPAIDSTEPTILLDTGRDAIGQLDWPRKGFPPSRLYRNSAPGLVERWKLESRGRQTPSDWEREPGYAR
jgi:hypothetical protein